MNQTTTTRQHAESAPNAGRGALTFWAALLLCAGAGWTQTLEFDWARAMGGAALDRGFSIAVDDAGNVYTTGSFSGTVDFDPGPGTINLTSAGFTDVFVQKLDAAGNFVWARAMGGPSFDTGFGITVDGAGYVYTTGRFVGTADFDPGLGTEILAGGEGNNVFVQKLDVAGNLVWARAMGGDGDDRGLDIALDGSGNVYTTGIFWETADFDPGAGTENLTSAGLADVFVHKLDGAGNFAWARAVGSPSPEDAGGLAVDGAGHVFTTGRFEGTVDFDPGPGVSNVRSVGNDDIFVQKLNGAGNFVWARAVGGTSDDAGAATAADTAGNVYTTGCFRGTVDFDPGPGTTNRTSAGADDVFVQKLDSAGNFLWVRTMGGASSEEGLGVAVDIARNVYTTGFFSETADFDPGPDTTTLSASSSPNVFVQKLDAAGDFVWAGALGGPLLDQGLGITVDRTGNAYATGRFFGTGDFDPGPQAANLTSAGLDDIFVSRLAPAEGPVVNTISPSTTGPTNADSIEFNVAFSAAVTNFEDAADLVIAHTGTTHTDVRFAGGPAFYTVTVDGIRGDGTFTLAVDTGSDVRDLAGNALTSSVTSNPVSIDNTPPAVADARLLSTGQTGTKFLVAYRVQFSEPVLGVTTAPPFDDFRITTGPPGAFKIFSAAEIDTVAQVSGTAYEIRGTIQQDASAPGGVARIDVLPTGGTPDLAGNPLPETFTAGEEAIFRLPIAPWALLALVAAVAVLGIRLGRVFKR